MVRDRVAKYTRLDLALPAREHQVGLGCRQTGCGTQHPALESHVLARGRGLARRRWRGAFQDFFHF